MKRYCLIFCFCQRRLCWLRPQFNWRKNSAEKWLWRVLPSMPACQWLSFHCSFTPGYISTGAKALMIPQHCVYLLISEFWKPLLLISFPVILDINSFSEVKWHVSEFMSSGGKKTGEQDAHCLLRVTMYRSSQVQVKKNEHAPRYLSISIVNATFSFVSGKRKGGGSYGGGKRGDGSCVKVKHRFSPRCKRRQKLHAVVLVLCAQVTAPIFLHPRDSLAAVSDKEASELASPPPGKHCKGIFTFKSWGAAPIPSQEWICWHV